MRNQLFSLYGVRLFSSQISPFVAHIQTSTSKNTMSKQANPSMGKQTKRTITANTSSYIPGYELDLSLPGTCNDTVGRCGGCVQVTTNNGTRCSCNWCSNWTQSDYGGFNISPYNPTKGTGNPITYYIYCENNTSVECDCNYIYGITFTNTFIKINKSLHNKSECEILTFLLGWYFGFTQKQNDGLKVSSTPPSWSNSSNTIVDTSGKFDYLWINNIDTSSNKYGCYSAPTVNNCSEKYVVKNYWGQNSGTQSSLCTACPDTTNMSN